MTLTNRSKELRSKPCDIRSDCSAAGVRAFVDSLSASNDEVLVFKRDAQTGQYEMSTACCEAVLPAVEYR